MGSLSLPCLCRGRWPEVFNVTFCFVKINPWICFTSIVYDFYILIFKTHHLLFECDQDWVLRDQDQILGVSGITISSLSSIKIEYLLWDQARPRLSDQEQILGMSGLTIPSLSATKIEYSGTTASCMMAFLLKYLFDLSRRCHFLNKGRKIIFYILKEEEETK